MQGGHERRASKGIGRPVRDRPLLIGLPQKVTNRVGYKLKITVEDHLPLKEHGVKKGSRDSEKEENAKRE